MDYLTRNGYKQLKEELEYLKNEKRWEVAHWLREASTQGDMDENAEYIAAKEEQDRIEQRIEQLEMRLRNARIVNTPRTNDVVQVGSKVRLATVKKNLKFRIVGVEEADVAKGDISTESPIGRALLGKGVGDVIEFPTPKGNKRYKITRIA
ncbi:MAG: hypothetical protein A2932_00395 [Candidatus Spechtbacteria bacterium RIFCSPLOWO2_01_FULL_46_10]|uniref:Transcription elongation factor GreA n=1 Tax=Candidatus Spechtbacteria bacterium RIFCSPLOWO2_01_FULL_46_10 TaxID=1802163 RepID=A0A1G2HI23_9BACT|nr:MAG: hypothetical protein A2932_00395 [Candidatus Spechtbacteria bacterium RIFCSPLOWO2_01_FULL_46_10]